MHLHRINMILRHDPLPKYLHVPNAHGQFNQVQCRQALISLSDLLKSYSSFVMLENQSYIKIIDGCVSWITIDSAAIVSHSV